MNHNPIEAVAERLARRAEAFECFRVVRRELSASFEAGRLKSAQTNQRSGVGLRVVVGGRMAVGGTSDPAALDRTVDSTLEAAAFGDPWTFPFAAPAAPAAVDVHDPRVGRLRPADLVGAGQQVVDRLADIAKLATVNVGIDAGEDEQAFVNSAGQRFNYQATHYGVSISVEFFGQDDIFFVEESGELTGPGIDLEKLVESVRRKFEQAREVVPAARQAGGGEQPIIFSPSGLLGLLVPLLTGLNGQSVADGVSPLADKRGGPAVVSERLTLIDDGTIPGRPGSQPFDDEGVPSQRTVLLGAGRVENFLLDLRTAGKLGLASTGNGSRGLTTPPTPQASNLILSPGDVPLGRMIAEVDDGLLVEFLLGVGQGNVSGGDFSDPIGLAFKIRGGRIVGRVKNCSIAGNVYEDLKRVTAVEDRGHWYGSLCLPHVRVEGVQLAVGE